MFVWDGISPPVPDVHHLARFVRAVDRWERLGIEYQDYRRRAQYAGDNESEHPPCKEALLDC